MSAALQAFFLGADAGRPGQRFCLHHAPAAGQATRGALVYVHPFAEEMNKSRRMAALQARALASAGYAVLQMDLLGCGDSSGDHGDATWSDWVGDAVQAAQWLRLRHGDVPLWFWGLRAGCLVAADAAVQLGAPTKLLFWQPSVSGKLVLQQFLRLALANRLLDAPGSGAAANPKLALAAGDTVELAGYRLSPALAAGLEGARLSPPVSPTTSVWLETSTRADAAPLPATQAAATEWRAAGHAASLSVVDGPAFWQTQEIEDAQALLAATVRALETAPEAA